MRQGLVRADEVPWCEPPRGSGVDRSTTNRLPKTVGMERHASGGAAGSSTRNVEPLPTSLVTVSVPPWAVTMA
jgi:hypothetical protein